MRCMQEIVVNSNDKLVMNNNEYIFHAVLLLHHKKQVMHSMCAEPYMTSMIVSIGKLEEYLRHLVRQIRILCSPYMFANLFHLLSHFSLLFIALCKWDFSV